MKKSILFCFLFFAINSTKSQDIGNILLAGEDASLLAENYLNPAITGLMSGMNSGWYSTAKTHKKLGFDITIGMSASFTPSKGQMFEFVSSQYNYLSVSEGDSELPTILSDNESVTIFDVSIPTLSGDFKVGSFSMPGGVANDLPINAVPTTFVQFALGLPLKILTFYAGLGYNSGTSNFDVDGDYTLSYDVQDSNQNVVGTLTENISDPINLVFSSTGTRATIGARLNLLFFKIFADYTIQEYNTASAGIAFNFK